MKKKAVPVKSALDRLPRTQYGSLIQSPSGDTRLDPEIVRDSTRGLYGDNPCPEGRDWRPYLIGSD